MTAATRPAANGSDQATAIADGRSLTRSTATTSRSCTLDAADPVDQRVRHHRAESAGAGDGNRVRARERQEHRHHPDVVGHPAGGGLAVVGEDLGERCREDVDRDRREDARRQGRPDADANDRPHVGDPALHAQARDHPGEAGVGAQFTGVGEDHEEGDRLEERARLAAVQRPGHRHHEQELREPVDGRADQVQEAAASDASDVGRTVGGDRLRGDGGQLGSAHELISRT